jgi:uncharacterized protein with ATP-grasp and redox domains
MPCFLKQALQAARFVTTDTVVHERAVRHVLQLAAEMDLSESPPVIGQRVHRLLRQITGNADPYHEEKKRMNRLALQMLPYLRERMRIAPDPFELAVRLSIAGNMIDLGIFSEVTESAVRAAFEVVLDEPFEGDIECFRRAVDDAESILFLADNAGEIVFDKLLIEQLPAEKLVLAVRGTPVINDATMEDAIEAGITDIVPVISNGSDAPGTVLSECSKEFRQHFESSDVIISKGQGNFETLNDIEKDIFFLFKIKCPVVASHTRFTLGSHVLIPPRIGVCR